MRGDSFFIFEFFPIQVVILYTYKMGNSCVGFGVTAESKVVYLKSKRLGWPPVLESNSTGIIGLEERVNLQVADHFLMLASAFEISSPPNYRKAHEYYALALSFADKLMKKMDEMKASGCSSMAFSMVYNASVLQMGVIKLAMQSCPH